MHRTTEFQVTAQADGQIVQPAFAAADGHQVGQGLGGMLVAAVTGVDHRDAGVAGSTQRCALLGVAHSHDVGIAGHHTDGVGHALAFAGAGHVLTGKAQHMAAQVQHGGLKRKAGAGGRLIEQGGQFFVGGHILIGGRIVVDAVGKVEQGGDFLLGEIQRVDQMTHGYVTSVTSKRFKAVCVKWKNQRSLCSSSANASPGGTND